MYVGKTIKLIYSTNIFSTSTPSLISMKMGISFENVNVATMEMKLGWKIKMNSLDEIHLDESGWNNYINFVKNIKTGFGSWFKVLGSRFTAHMVASLLDGLPYDDEPWLKLWILNVQMLKIVG